MTPSVCTSIQGLYSLIGKSSIVCLVLLFNDIEPKCAFRWSAHHIPLLDGSGGSCFQTSGVVSRFLSALGFCWLVRRYRVEASIILDMVSHYCFKWCLVPGRGWVRGDMGWGEEQKWTIGIVTFPWKALKIYMYKVKNKIKAYCPTTTTRVMLTNIFGMINGILNKLSRDNFNCHALLKE